MKLTYKISVLFLLLGIFYFQINLIFGQAVTTFIDDGEEYSFDSIIEGTSGDRSLIQKIMGSYSSNYLSRILINHPDALNENVILREEWLKHYNIEDGGGNIRVEGDINGKVEDKLLIKVGEKTTFVLNDVPVKKINLDGSIELENRATFSDGLIEFENGIIYTDGGTLDITDINKEILTEFEIKKDGKVKIEDELYASLNSEILFTSDRSFEMVVFDDPLNVKIGGNEILFEGRLGTDEFAVDGKFKIDENGNNLFKGVMKANQEDIDNIYIESKNNFVQYLTEDGRILDETNYVYNNDGNLIVGARGLDGNQMSINDAGGIKSISIDKVNDESKILYYKGSSLIAKIDKEGLVTTGLISQLGKVSIIDPRTQDFESISNIVGDIFNEDQLLQTREIKVAKELMNNVKDLNEPIAIMISNENYLGDKNPPHASHDSAEKVLNYLIEQEGIKKGYIRIKDHYARPLKNKLKAIRSQYPESDFVVYYSGHGNHDKRSDTYYIQDPRGNPFTAKDFNEVFVGKKPIYIIDMCFAGGLCTDLNRKMAIAGMQNHQVGTQFRFRGEPISLFSETLISPTSPQKIGWAEITLTDQLILNGIEDRWLTEIYSIESRGIKQTPIVFR